MPNELPNGLMRSFIGEMKKHPDFRTGWYDGNEHGLQSKYLLQADVSNYRQKFGALVACWENGLVTDVLLNRHQKSVSAFLLDKRVYFFIEKG